MTETRDSMFLRRVELQCEGIPEWLASNPGWHQWSVVLRMPEFVGYIPPHSRAIRERLEREGRIRVANGHMRGGRPIMVAHPTEDTPPPHTLGQQRRDNHQRNLTTVLAAIEETKCDIAALKQSVERIAAILEQCNGATP